MYVEAAEETCARIVTDLIVRENAGILVEMEQAAVGEQHLEGIKIMDLEKCLQTL